MPTDTKINLVINKLTKSQYDTAVANNQISGSQLYCITDVTEIPVTAVNPVTTTGTLTSIGINGTNYALPTPLLPITSVNPATSTATLTSIGINGTNYELAGSGGDADITYASELPSDTTGIDDGAYYAIPADDSGSGGGGGGTTTQMYKHDLILDGNMTTYSGGSGTTYSGVLMACLITDSETAITSTSALAAYCFSFNSKRIFPVTFSGYVYRSGGNEYYIFASGGNADLSSITCMYGGSSTAGFVTTLVRDTVTAL